MTANIPEPFMCDHSGPRADGKDTVTEVYREVGGYVPAIPNYYKCTICGSEFPCIGDTDMWEPVMVDCDAETS